MSLSKKHKAYKANGGTLSFAEWAVKYDRLVVARAARGSAPKVRKAVVKAVQPAAEYVRVQNRVDCFGTTKKGITILGADASDGKVVARLCNGKVVGTYTSKRGERARIECKLIGTTSRKLVEAGFTPKGF
jgi:hypothetical protein